MTTEPDRRSRVPGAAPAGSPTTPKALLLLGAADPLTGHTVVRIAPHHFTDIARALGEIHRVIRPVGRFVVEDSSVPVDPLLDAYLQ